MQSEGMSYSYRMPGSPEGAPRVWVLKDYRVFDAGDQTSLVRTRDGRAFALVGRAVAAGLGVCRRVATMEDHAARLARATRAPDRSQVLQALIALRDRGFFVLHDDYLGRLRREGAVEESLLPGVFVRTSDRTGELARLLGHLGMQGGNSHTVTVVDDTIERKGAQANRRACEESASGFLDIQYHGRSDHLAAVLGRGAFEPEEQLLLHWLLAPERPDGQGSYGAALNRVLLLSAGQRALLMDDDAQPTAFLPDDVKPAAVTISAKPYQSRYFPSAHPYAERFIQQSLDPFHEHEQLLGRTIGSIIEPMAPEALRELARSLDRDSLDHLRKTSTVKLTVNGVLGDSGTPSNLRVLLAEPQNLGVALNSEVAYRELLEKHHVWRGRTELNLSPICMLTASTLVGLDNRSLVPPVLPLGRGEDYLFSAALEFLYPDMFIAELPWSLRHAPDRQRTYEHAVFRAPVTPSAIQILAEAIRAEAGRCSAEQPEDRLLQLSGLVTGWAKRDDRAFSAMWEDMVVAARAAVLGQLEASLRRHAGSPDFVRADLQRLLKLNNDFRPETLKPVSMAAIRRDWARYGQALAIWPRLWETFHTHAPGTSRESAASPRRASGRGQP